MGSDYQNQIPVIDLSSSSLDKVRGSQEWDIASKKVKEACEDYGCFEVVYDKISKQVRAELFSLIRQLFMLPVETRKKNYNPKPYHGYAGQYPVVPIYEGFGIEDVSSYNSLEGFAEQLSWPHDHDQFCKTFSSMMKPLDELHGTIGKLILDSYGLGEKRNSIMPCKTLLRMMKYRAPQPGENSTGLFAHTDKPFCTLLCEDGVAALEVETKHGHWIQLSPSPNSFIFLVGDPLMAWSNGRLHAVKHRVIMNGDEDRYSIGAFLVPIEGTVIKPQKELIDECHPQILKEFDFMEYLTFSSSAEAKAMDSAKQVFAFAGNQIREKI
ncbi:probable 2-oxoglutarate-dependent dioxygenase AOP1 [Ricinus communis]|uniref:2-oxoglutarate-dependent dioxygenase DAO n=1 Tax=Ricinus communis TaxID=3988 RepID=B9RPC7_RICCO|nr:probable 2-oxoglutarate-dependent dioxygenase AOP1 [Ricinus communis]EEF47045.1 Gibberellin 3-beta-dioxygenase, putative [Ricinus communis]|eukprot:XP_002515596.1 probable 2-oxoglutarate-dependent dioxygenase AOP1 [Ricinus communis]